jgi:hypothetical protein
MELKEGSTFVTQRGDSGRVIAIDRQSDSHPVVALVSYDFGLKARVLYTADGKYYADGRTSRADIAYSPDLPNNLTTQG